ncbi:MAG TPA: VanZ family protein [Candidatus Acidoferrum sp.]
MADPQPWRNPRPAPQLSEMQGRVQAPRSFQRLMAWMPAMCWAAVIFSLSTDTFSAAHTGRILRLILFSLMPHLPEHTFRTIHFLVRKAAHFTEYFVFCLLLFRGIRGGQRGWRWSWALAALFIAAGYSALDEIHQAFVASRTASPYDSLLDSVGAGVAVVAMWVWFRIQARNLDYKREHR